MSEHVRDGRDPSVGRWHLWIGPAGSGGHALPGVWPRLLLMIVGGSACYGATMGLWHGPRLAAYVAIKLPLALLVTSALTMGFNWLAARLAGLHLPLPQVATMTFGALATGAMLLLALVPVALLFTWTFPAPSTEARATHNLLILIHTVLVGAACSTGTVSLFGFLRRIAPSRRTARAVFAAWFLMFAFVGGEVAWAFRPFIGSIYLEQRFLRDDALDGTVYEFILFDVMPYLGRHGTEVHPHDYQRSPGRLARP